MNRAQRRRHVRLWWVLLAAACVVFFLALRERDRVEAESEVVTVTEGSR